MRWQHKARIMKICDGMPAGDKIYKFIQKNFGHLDANPMSRLQAQIVMARWILQQGKTIELKTFFEVGTGHKPVIPIGFFLSGAKQVITVDLNRRIDFGLTRKVLSWIAENAQSVESMYLEVVNSSTLCKRIEIVKKLQDDPKTFLEKANIKYLAPYDASSTELPDNSVDYHISTTVLEHITELDIKRILLEAKRLLKKDGVALHFIDLSDHFQHQDTSITKINFLRYSDKEWNRIARNEFAYTNRLRASNFMEIFSDLSFKILKSELNIDQESLSIIKNGFSVDNKFQDYTLEDLITTRLRVMLCCD